MARLNAASAPPTMIEIESVPFCAPVVPPLTGASRKEPLGLHPGQPLGKGRFDHPPNREAAQEELIVLAFICPGEKVIWRVRRLNKTP